MNSFNNIERIKYENSQEDIVSLNEYIIFSDDEKKEKKILFKFTNNLNQNLYEIKFEISEYDIDNNLIAKTIILYDDFKASKNETFVPKAKMNANYSCKTISIKLLAARFEEVYYELGEFNTIPFTFKEQLSYKDVENDRIEKKKEHKRPRAYKVKDITKKNKTIITKVYKVFFSIVIIALIVAAVIYNAYTSDVIYDDVFHYKLVENNQLEIIDYVGDESEVSIPTEMYGRRISSLAADVFNSNIEKVEIKGNVIINKYAFRNCTKLEEVIGNNVSFVYSDAFLGCVSLTNISFENATLDNNSLRGTQTIKNISYKNTISSTLKNIFNTTSDETYEFETIITNESYISSYYFEGIDKIDTLVLTNEDVSLNIGAVEYLVNVGCEIDYKF